uniref:ubiquitinyl hydrolase 1 n=2 Tax=Aceria tosichella TaxID=561515 RepID=A0A6G1S417_9ACAR
MNRATSDSKTDIGPGNNNIRIYHERQSKQLCALHALNNLFQSPKAFTKHELDTICKELAPDARIFNPHRSVLGLGCYDVNVIIAALGKKGYDVIWFDKRKDPSCLVLDKILGFILNVPNVPSYTFFAMPLNYIPMQAQIWSSQKHWITIRKIGQYYYNLDSKLISPVCVGDEVALLQHFRQNSSIEQVEILIVVPKCVAEDQSWIRR